MSNKAICILSLGLLFSANAFADDMTLLPNSQVSNACTASNTGVYSGSFVMVPVYEDTIYNCAPGTYLPRGTEQCETCLENSYCPGGEYTYSTEVDGGITSCTSGLVAPSGMWESGQCGRLLHLGNVALYMRSERKTTKSLNFMTETGEIFYLNMTTADVPMNKDTTKMLKASDGTTTWSIYDDTVSTPTE